MNGRKGHARAVIIEDYPGDINKADVENLVNYFGLGNRVSEILLGLNCLTVKDLKRLKSNSLTYYTTEITARRIMLLKKYAEIRWPG